MKLTNSKMTAKRLGKAIRACRKERGLLLRDLEITSKLTIAHLSHFETGKRFPSVYNLIAIADAMGVSLDELIGRKVRVPKRYLSEEVDITNKLL